MNTDRITSFQTDHRTIRPGVYLSRVDGDVATYDIRTRTPNAGEYMDNVTMHSVEHIIATFLRNSEIKDRVIYFGPMGCQTGFYLCLRDVPHNVALEMIKKSFDDASKYDGEMFGASEIECGNYRALSVETAVKECASFLSVLENCGVADLLYPDNSNKGLFGL